MPPPPPPPPPAPPAPPAPPPAPPSVSSSSSSGGSSSGSGDAGPTDTFALLKQKQAEAVAHEYRPKTPPPRAPDVYCDVKVSWLDAQELFNSVQFGSNLLVVDVRSAADYVSSHVRSALGVDWSAMAGVLSDGEEEAEGEEASAAAATAAGAGEGSTGSGRSKLDTMRWRQRRTFNVVVYDAESTPEAIAPGMKSFLDAMRAERLCQAGVRVLDGGLSAFARDYAFLVKGHPEFMDGEYPSEIIKSFLFLGPWEVACSRAALNHLGITRVVNATASCDMPFKDDPSIDYIYCPLDDSPEADIAQYFEPCMKFLQEAKTAGHRVLVHCKMGMSRSPTIIILWLMETQKMSLREATEYVRKKRPFINPNPGFLQQLGQHEEKIHGECTVRFPEGEVITTRTIYEWRTKDGGWEPRKVVGFKH